MSIVRKTISLTQSQDDWIKSKVASGQFASDSEVHRALVKDVQVREEKLNWLKDELEKGLNSPMIDQTPQEIIAELKSELKARGEI